MSQEPTAQPYSGVRIVHIARSTTVLCADLGVDELAVVPAFTRPTTRSTRSAAVRPTDEQLIDAAPACAASSLDDEMAQGEYIGI